MPKKKQIKPVKGWAIKLPTTDKITPAQVVTQMDWCDCGGITGSHDGYAIFATKKEAVAASSCLEEIIPVLISPLTPKRTKNK